MDEDNHSSNGNERGQSYIVRELIRRVNVLERTCGTMHDRVQQHSYRIEHGMTGGADRMFVEVKASILSLEKQVDAIERKTTKWEGGGYVLYAMISLVGGFIGWLLTKIEFR